MQSPAQASSSTPLPALASRPLGFHLRPYPGLALLQLGRCRLLDPGGRRGRGGRHLRRPLGLALDVQAVELAERAQAVPAMWRRFLADCPHTWPALGLGLGDHGLPPALPGRIGDVMGSSASTAARITAALNSTLPLTVMRSP